MILAKKVRLKPTLEQEQQLWKAVGTSRWAYNWALSKQEESYKQSGEFISDEVLRKELTILKKEEQYSWLYEVSNNVTKQAIRDLCDSYKRFFKGLADRPKFKSRRQSKPSFYNPNDKIKIESFYVLIQKVGWISTAEKIPYSKKYSNPRISFDGKYWYLSIGIEQKEFKTKLTKENIGIDVGIKDLAVCSNGMVFKNINKTRVVKQIEKRLHRLQRQVSRKYVMNKKGNIFIRTKNIIKIENQIKHLFRRLTNIRINHIHQATTTIVKTKPCRVVIETLNLRGMMKNKHLSKAIMNQKLYDFRLKLRYKCEKYGIKLIEANGWFPSSKMCSACGQVKKDLKLSERKYRCNCGNMMDRDLNAAINLSRY